MIDLKTFRTGESGYWSIRARTIDGTTLSDDLITFHGVPTTVSAIEWTDPFGPSQATLSFPGVNMLERVGADMWWSSIGTEFDIMFVVTDPEIAEPLRKRRALTDTKYGPAMVWEGYVESRSWTHDSNGAAMTLELLGAMRILDSRLAQKVTFGRPVPYEKLIQGHFAWADSLHPTGLAPVRIIWPDWWTTTYRKDDSLPVYLQPEQVAPGDKWTGMIAREFGRWDPVLSSAVQGMLSTMFTERGQFTLDLYPGRLPVLRHRDRVLTENDHTLHVDAVWPGVSLELVEDGSMTVNAVYGEARSSMSGTSYTGKQYTISGETMPYMPFSELGAVGQANKDESVVRRELYINFNDGLAPSEAMEKARQHIQRNSTPGFTGTVKLSGVTPLIRSADGELVPFPIECLRAGDHIMMHGIQGGEVLMHVSQARIEPGGDAVLTVDTKYRDYMTVREVIERGRDALRPWHMMTVGRYNVNIKDAVLPWNYTEGSGFIPLGSHQTSFWEGAPNDLAFPWTEWTTKRPPMHRAWRNAYIQCKQVITSPTGYAEPNRNWGRGEVLLSQAGDISLLQIAAFNQSGRLKRVPFHVSIWLTSADETATPLLAEDTDVKFIDWDGTNHVVRSTKYRASSDGNGRYWPYYKDAWEQTTTSGAGVPNEMAIAPTDSGLIVGYGNYWEKAGYWPGTGRSDPLDLYPDGSSSLPQALPTGMFVDDTGWSYDFTQFDIINLYDPSANNLLEHANATVLIYCESTTPTFFLGRVFRKEYGG